MTAELWTGDCRRVLSSLRSESVHCVVTSPPYFGLRDYKVDGQLGLEKTPAEYVVHLVEVFRGLRRVLRPDGVAWLVLGDSFGHGTTARREPSHTSTKVSPLQHQAQGHRHGSAAKQLIGIPWRVALALQDDGWFLRSDVVWHKPNVMPESVRDRPTRSHEYVFLLTRSARYYYDADAVREPHTSSGRKPGRGGRQFTDRDERHSSDEKRAYGEQKDYNPAGRNRRTVWTVATVPYREAHYATFPPALIEPMILAGTSEAGCCSACGAPWRRRVKQAGADMAARYARGEPTRHELNGAAASKASNVGGYSRAAETTGWQPSCSCGAPAMPCTVLDPFAGSGTTLAVAAQHGRHAVGIELNPADADRVRRRVSAAAPDVEIKHFDESVDKAS